MGRQPGSNVFVLGPNLQFWSNGDYIPAEEQTYVWVDYLLKKLKVITQIHPLSDLSVVRRPLHTALKSIKKLSGQNVLSAVHILGESKTECCAHQGHRQGVRGGLTKPPSGRTILVNK